MDITYNLQIGDFHVMPETGEGNPENVVLAINYALVGVTQHKGVWYAHSWNEMANVAPENFDFSAINRDTFTAFENLTKEQVEGWIYSTISPEKLEMMKENIKHKLIDETSLNVRAAPWIQVNPPYLPEEPILE
jgi:hypothetical protein